ncbi:phage virion morphogenesis protein [uncultured Sphaerotilus sp.]|uniref:phage virion morphogenesis protein n=1 Tax=uncultured Sphaerotilus sp. TaxID=474984 RepID=UPI0030CA3837
MSARSIQIIDEGFADGLQRLLARGGNLGTLTFLIGQGIEERIDKRFATSTGPDGQRWKANSDLTLAREAVRLAVSGANKKKDGSLNKRGAKLLAGKKPLIGETGRLRDQIVALADATGVTVTDGGTEYAAMHQFGGTRAQFPNLWGDIPARPFMPITASGDLYPAEAGEVMADLNDYFRDLG